MSATSTLNYIFRRYDADDDGELDQREFNLFLYELGRNDLSEAKMKACFRLITPPEAQKIKLEEFISGVPKLYECHFNPTTSGEAKEKRKIKATKSGTVSEDRVTKSTPLAFEIEKLVLEEKRKHHHKSSHHVHHYEEEEQNHV